MATRASARLAQKKVKEVPSSVEDTNDKLGGNPNFEGDESDSEQATRQKHKRKVTKNSKKSTGKKVRGQQGRLSGFVNMPIDIFTEIASHLFPIDIISLSRSNKFFRNLLMQQPSAHIWRATMKNVPDLPPCPPGMSEPNYLALLFSKTCSLCGQTARVGLDEVLLVRLCASCRDTELIPLDNVPKKIAPFVYVSQSIAPGNRRVGNGYVLRGSLAGLQAEHERVKRSKDKNLLESWVKSRKGAIDQRKKDATVLADVLYTLERNHERIQENATQVRQTEIKRRLEELGWTKEDMSFGWRSKHGNPYRVLVDQPKPLTERIWSNILPKLTPLLEANRAENLEAARLQRMRERRTRLSELFLEIKNQSPPAMEFQVQLPDPPPSDKDPITTVFFEPPFPSLVCLLSWPIIKNLHETEATVDEMEADFEEKRGQIQVYITEWKSSVEARFANLIREGPEIQGDILRATTIISSNGDPFSSMTQDLKLLLRADSLFYEASHYTHKEPLTYGCILGSEGLVGDNHSISPWGELDSAPELGNFVVSPRAQDVARTLLVSMGRPNATYLEMQAIGDGFGCGRCFAGGLNWRRLIFHYIRQHDLYIKVHENPSHLLEEAITYNDVHNPELYTDRPMVQYRSAPGWRRFARPAGLLEVCSLCKKIPAVQYSVALPKPEMIQHLLDVHSITNPKANIHYVTQKSNSGWFW